MREYLGGYDSTRDERKRAYGAQRGQS